MKRVRASPTNRSSANLVRMSRAVATSGAAASVVGSATLAPLSASARACLASTSSCSIASDVLVGSLTSTSKSSACSLDQASSSARRSSIPTRTAGFLLAAFSAVVKIAPNEASAPPFLTPSKKWVRSAPSRPKVSA